MKEFKGTIGKWNITTSKKGNHYMNVGGNCEFIKVYSGKRSGYEVNQKANALLISKAPEMLEMLNKARIELSRIKSSMMAHPDCTIGSEFDDYTSSAQECENEIELLIKEATEL